MTLREPEPQRKQEKNTHPECSECEAVGYSRSQIGQQCTKRTGGVLCTGTVVEVEEDD